MNQDDGYLLLRFADNRDEACFRELVERRVGFVYAVSLRRLRNPHLAQEATQSVFIALARKAAKVARGPSVMGWLHRSSCYESRNLMRAQVNRLSRESEAQRLGTAESVPAVAREGEGMELVLDDVLSTLPAADREAILARYFSAMSYAEIGAASGRTENAARMRVDRALAKLRGQLQQRGFDSTAAVLSGLLPSFATAAVPPGLMARIAQSALSGVGATTIPLTFLAFMNTTKIAAITGIIAAAGVIGFEVQKTRALEHELRTVREEHAQSMTSVRELEKQVSALKARPHPPETAVASKSGSADAAVKPAADVPGITRKAPAGWHKNGSNVSAYDVGVDETQSWGGMPSAYVKSISAAAEGSFGGMMQTTAAQAYHNKRVKLSGWVKTEDAPGGGHLWLRIDGQKAGESLGFDNMNSRAPKGTTDWQEYSSVLDVPSEASTINYGFFVDGAGKMWVSGLTIQPVGPEVPSTNMVSPKPNLPTVPVNLGFSPK
jgi:RNA polymerase sigma factor (sigma-70 family)